MTTTMSIRIDDKLKKSAQKVAKDLGMDLSTAIKLFLVQMTWHKGLPFYVGADCRLSPKEERHLTKLSDDAMKNGKRYTSVDALFKDILDE